MRCSTTSQRGTGQRGGVEVPSCGGATVGEGGQIGAGFTLVKRTKRLTRSEPSDRGEEVGWGSIAPAALLRPFLVTTSLSCLEDETCATS